MKLSNESMQWKILLYIFTLQLIFITDYLYCENVSSLDINNYFNNEFLKEYNYNDVVLNDVNSLLIFLNSNSEYYQMYSNGIFILKNHFHKKDLLDKAYKYFHKLYQKYKNPILLKNILDSLIAQGKLSEVKDIYRRYNHFHNDSIILIEDFASIEMLNNNYNISIMYLERILKMYPFNIRAEQHLASAYIALADYKKAQEIFMNMINKCKVCSSAYVGLSIIASKKKGEERNKIINILEMRKSELKKDLKIINDKLKELEIQ